MRTSLRSAMLELLGTRRADAVRAGYRAYRAALGALPEPAGAIEARRNADRINACRELHAGKRCFIIGNGPSLNRTNLGLLKNEITVGFNRIYLKFAEMGFPTTYYMVSNPHVASQFAVDIAALPCIRFITDREKDNFVASETMMFLHVTGGPPHAPIFVRGVASQVCGGGTVTYVALQMAYFMGFKEVILIGVDHHFETQGAPNELVVSQGGDPNHFDPNYFGAGVAWQLPDLERSEIAYRLAKYQYEENGRRILDATVDGKLQVFPKVRLENVVAR